MKSLRRFRTREGLTNYVNDLSDAELIRYMDQYGVDINRFYKSKSYISALRNGTRSMSPAKRKAIRQILIDELAPRYLTLRKYLDQLAARYSNFDMARSLYFLEECAKCRYVFPDRKMTIFTNKSKLGPFRAEDLWARVVLWVAPLINKTWVQHMWFTPGSSDPYSDTFKENYDWENDRTNERLANPETLIEFYEPELEGSKIIGLGAYVYQGRGSDLARERGRRK